eukprot:g16447.t1
MANTKKLPSQCGQPGCEKRPTYGLKGSKKREFCSQHAKKGMINVNNKRCIQPNCPTIPSFALAGSKKAEFCSQHAMEGMIDVRSKRTSGQRGSTNQAARKSSSGKTPASSSSSPSGEGLAGLRNKRCGRRGCSKRASYAPGAGGGNAGFCDQHATDGMLVGGVLRGLGDYSRGAGGSAAGQGAGAGAGPGANDQRYSGDGLAAGTKRKLSSLPLPPPPVPTAPAAPAAGAALSYPLTTPEYLHGSIAADPSASRSNKRAGAGAGANAPAALPLSPPLMQFRPPSNSSALPYPLATADYLQGSLNDPSSRGSKRAGLGGGGGGEHRYMAGESSLQSAGLGATATATTATPLMQQFRPQSAERYALGGGGGDSSQQFRPQSSERYLGAATASVMPDASAYSDITSVFDKDV